jgi:phage virion morphogenesis protein
MNISLKGDITLSKLVYRLDRATQNAMPIIAQSIKTQILINWKQSKDPMGAPWKPLAQRTIKAKLKKNGNIVMLKDTGKLRNSLNSYTTKNKAIIGYSAKYAKYHQFGTIAMPPRKILPETLEDIDTDRIKGILQDELQH